jgi:Protein of unknown function (DUF732)
VRNVIAVGVGGPLAAAALWLGVGTAHAQPSDDEAFLKAVHNNGIGSNAGDADLIKAAQQFCAMRRNGYSENSLINSEAIRATQLDRDTIRFFVETSEAAYCPEFIN